MSYEDELIQRMERETREVRSDAVRRAHYLKMAASGGLAVLCLGLFALGVLGGDRGQAQVRSVAAARKTGRKVDPKAVEKGFAAATLPEMGALVLGGASGLYFLFLMMRLRRLD